jgi:hypothetical protein
VGLTYTTLLHGFSGRNIAILSKRDLSLDTATVKS